MHLPHERVPRSNYQRIASSPSAKGYTIVSDVGVNGGSEVEEGV